MIGKGETHPSVILEKKRSGEINGCSRMKESEREREEHEEKEEEEVRKR
jgi:hypothetical protein